MASNFFDSSALAKPYVTENGTGWVQSLTDPVAGHGIYAARITLVELVSAITRRQRSGSLTPADAASALNDLQTDFASAYWIIEVTAGLIAQAAIVAEKHALRAYDSVQLAAAMQANAAYVAAGLPSLTLISADLDVKAAAT